MTNLEGRVLRRRRALTRRPGVRDRPRRPGRAGATGSGRGTASPTDRGAVFDELRRASAGGIADYAGITYERIDAEQGVFWPCPIARPPGHAAAVRRRASRTPDGRARFAAVEHRRPGRAPDADFPYVLTTGRVHAALPDRHADPPGRAAAGRGGRVADVELHPDLARRARHRRRRRGRAAHPARAARSFRARLTDTIRPDTVFVPFHWGGTASANALTDPALDPTSRMPAFKVCAVAVSRVDSAPVPGPSAVDTAAAAGVVR